MENCSFGWVDWVWFWCRLTFGRTLTHKRFTMPFRKIVSLCSQHSQFLNLLYICSNHIVWHQLPLARVVASDKQSFRTASLPLDSLTSFILVALVQSNLHASGTWPQSDTSLVTLVQSSRKIVSFFRKDMSDAWTENFTFSDWRDFWSLAEILLNLSLNSLSNYVRNPLQPARNVSCSFDTLALTSSVITFLNWVIMCPRAFRIH